MFQGQSFPAWFPPHLEYLLLPPRVLTYWSLAWTPRVFTTLPLRFTWPSPLLLNPFPFCPLFIDFPFNHQRLIYHSNIGSQFIRYHLLPNFGPPISNLCTHSSSSSTNLRTNLASSVNLASYFATIKPLCFGWINYCSKSPYSKGNMCHKMLIGIFSMWVVSYLIHIYVTVSTISWTALAICRMHKGSSYHPSISK